MMLQRLMLVCMAMWACTVFALEKNAPAEKSVEPVVNLFPAQTWQPPPPPPPPPAKPTAPPLPFQFGGRLLEGENTTVFLFQQKRQLIVKQGDEIDNLYRVDAVTPARIDFTYLPLKEKQQLLTGITP